MRKFYATLVLCMLAFSLFSQHDTLLKNFKYRINTYRAINYRIDGGSQFRTNELVTGTIRNTSAFGNLGAAYFTTKSTDKILFTASSSFYSSFSAVRHKGINDVNTNKGLNIFPQIHVLNKWFAKGWFTELGADAETLYYTSKSTGAAISDPTKYNRTNYNFGINTGIGKGRLENITDMQNALWLYKDLQDEKLLSRPLTGGELNELGKAVTLGNNTRILDSRRRTQFILKTVDNYFQKNGLIAKTDINYFMHLNDILFFAFNNPRLSGTEKFVRFTYGLNGDNDNTHRSNPINKSENRYNNQKVSLSSGIQKYVPVSLTHQNNYGATVTASSTKDDITNRYFTSGVITNETKINTTLKEAGLSAFFEHAIYPNTRTNINFYLKAGSGYQDVNSQSGFYGEANLNASFNYFISYRTRFTCYASAAYQKNKYYYNNQRFGLETGRVWLNANAGLEISL